MKVYLLFYQDYDDVSVHGIFSSNEKAEQIKKEYNSDCDIYEIELDTINLMSCFINGLQSKYNITDIKRLDNDSKHFKYELKKV